MSEPFLSGNVLYLAPLSRHWNASIKATFSQVAEPFTQMAGCASKMLANPFYLRIMKI